MAGRSRDGFPSRQSFFAVLKAGAMKSVKESGKESAITNTGLLNAGPALRGLLSSFAGCLLLGGVALMFAVGCKSGGPLMGPPTGQHMRPLAVAKGRPKSRP